jgi:EPS-associated MarR family transcriptional regulator
MLTDEVRYKLYGLLEENPEMSQRDVARKLGVSVGKVNFCIKALVERGFVKASRFRNSKNKVAYMYLLTPSGVRHKTRVTTRFLRRRIELYEELRAEIELLRGEARRQRRRAS